MKNHIVLPLWWNIYRNHASKQTGRQAIKPTKEFPFNQRLIFNSSMQINHHIWMLFQVTLYFLHKYHSENIIYPTWNDIFNGFATYTIIISWHNNARLVHIQMILEIKNPCDFFPFVVHSFLFLLVCSVDGASILTCVELKNYSSGISNKAHRVFVILREKYLDCTSTIAPITFLSPSKIMNIFSVNF